MTKKPKARKPKNILFPFHKLEFNAYFDFKKQIVINAGLDRPGLSLNPKEARKLAAWLTRAADWLEGREE